MAFEVTEVPDVGPKAAPDGSFDWDKSYLDARKDLDAMSLCFQRRRRHMSERRYQRLAKKLREERACFDAQQALAKVTQACVVQAVPRHRDLDQRKGLRLPSLEEWTAYARIRKMTGLSAPVSSPCAVREWRAELEEANKAIAEKHGEVWDALSTECRDGIAGRNFVPLRPTSRSRRGTEAGGAKS